MKRVVLIISLAFAVSVLWAQDLDQIIEKTNQAIGTEARSKIKHMQSNGYYVMSGTEAKMPFKLQQSKPINIRIETTIIHWEISINHSDRLAFVYIKIHLRVITLASQTNTNPFFSIHSKQQCRRFNFIFGRP